MYVVTGGGRGIGKAITCALASRGQSVMVVGRDAETLAKTASFSPKIDMLCADMSDKAGRHKLIDALKEYKAVDGLVHNAGTIEPIIPLSEIDEDDWHRLIALNLNAPLFLTQALLPLMEKGRVLHIGSGAAYFPVYGWGAYCVSKAALSMLTRCWQMETENESIAFTSIMPGICLTDMMEQILASDRMQDSQHLFMKNLKDANRMVLPETVAAFVTWLLLDIDRDTYISKEWDLYDTAHHSAWLVPPYVVPPLE